MFFIMMEKTIDNMGGEFEAKQISDFHYLIKIFSLIIVRMVPEFKDRIVKLTKKMMNMKPVVPKDGRFKTVMEITEGRGR